MRGWLAFWFTAAVPSPCSLLIGRSVQAMAPVVPRDLSLHLLWPRSNAPNNTPFPFYSVPSLTLPAGSTGVMSLTIIINQNYGPQKKGGKKEIAHQPRFQAGREALSSDWVRKVSEDLHVCSQTAELQQNAGLKRYQSPQINSLQTSGETRPH